MLVHDQFVFLQMRKTASTFLASALRRELSTGAFRVLVKHWGWSRIPADAAHLPVLVYIRDPWDWYVSWYHFNLIRGGTRTGFWRLLSEDGALGFKDTVRNALVRGDAIMGGDLYTTLFRNMVSDGFNSELLRVGRFESLFDDLAEFLSEVGVALSPGAIARMRTLAPVNQSLHRDYREYYDSELYALVERWCAPLIERFGYGSGQSAPGR